MGCKECGKPKCNGECGCKSPKVLQINNPAEYITFHKVSIPAAMGDSTTNPPKIGAYRNALVYYEADHTSWMYSTDGIPTKLTNGITDYNEAVNLPQINGHTLIGNQSSSDLGLQGELTAGANIQINGNVISATDTTYTAGNGIELDGTEIKAKIGDGLEFDNDGEINVADIEQYAHFFNTVADMKAADLSDGEFAVTAGYYAVNDGGGANYKIANSSETADGGSIIALNSGLKALLIVKNNTINLDQFGAKGDGLTDNNTAMANALAYGGEAGRTIVLGAGKHYKVLGNHFIKSNTTIDLNSATLEIQHWFPDLESVCEAGYTGITNICLKNGIMTGDVHFDFYHSTKIKVDNILFDDAHRTWHLFDLAGVDGFEMTNCEVYGNNNSDWSSMYASIETIQTDYATEGSQPTLKALQPNMVHDNIPTKNVLIKNCYFHKKDSDTYCSQYIGTHANPTGEVINNVSIVNCKFEGWYRNAIRFFKVKNLLIDRCTFIPKEITITNKYNSAAIQIQPPEDNTYAVYSDDIIITNNTMIAEDAQNSLFFLQLVDKDGGDYKMRNVLVSGNEYAGFSENNFFDIGYAENVTITNNIVDSCKFFFNKNNNATISNLCASGNIVRSGSTFLRSAIGDDWASSEVDNLNSDNNILTFTRDDVETTLNTSSFRTAVTITSNQTFSDVWTARIPFDTSSNNIVTLAGSGNATEMKIYRDARRVKLSGSLVAKVDPGAKITKIEYYVWDLRTASKLLTKDVLFSDFTSENWQRIDLPELFLEDNFLSDNGSHTRFDVFVRITCTGNAYINKDGTELIFSNW